MHFSQAERRACYIEGTQCVFARLKILEPTYPGHGFVVHEVLEEADHRVGEEVDGVGVTENHGEVTQHLLLATPDAVQEPLQLTRPVTQDHKFLSLPYGPHLTI